MNSVFSRMCAEWPACIIPVRRREQYQQHDHFASTAKGTYYRSVRLQSSPFIYMNGARLRRRIAQSCTIMSGARTLTQNENASGECEAFNFRIFIDRSNWQSQHLKIESKHVNRSNPIDHSNMIKHLSKFQIDLEFIHQLGCAIISY